MSVSVSVSVCVCVGGGGGLKCINPHFRALLQEIHYYS